jgi:hypothetical protein
MDKGRHYLKVFAEIEDDMRPVVNEEVVSGVLAAQK